DRTALLSDAAGPKRRVRAEQAFVLTALAPVLLGRRRAPGIAGIGLRTVGDQVGANPTLLREKGRRGHDRRQTNRGRCETPEAFADHHLSPFILARRRRPASLPAVAISDRCEAHRMPMPTNGRLMPM